MKLRRIIPGILVVAGVLALAAVVAPRVGIGLASSDLQGQAGVPQGGLAVSDAEGQRGDGSQLKGSAQDAGDSETMPFVGIGLESLSQQELTDRGIENGVLIAQVVDDSPAAGVLIQDDVITAINAQPVSTPQDVIDVVRGASPGDVLTFTVMRGEQSMDVDVTVGEREVDSRDRIHPGYPMFYHHMGLLDDLIKAEVKVEADDGTRTYRAAVGTPQNVNVQAGTFDLMLKDGSETISYQITGDTRVFIGNEGSLAGLNTEDEALALDVMVNQSGTWEPLIVAQGEILEHHGGGFGGPHHPFMGMGQGFQGAPEMWERIEKFLPPGMAEGMEGGLFDQEG